GEKSPPVGRNRQSNRNLAVLDHTLDHSVGNLPDCNLSVRFGGDESSSVGMKSGRVDIAAVIRVGVDEIIVVDKSVRRPELDDVLPGRKPGLPIRRKRG